MVCSPWGRVLGTQSAHSLVKSDDGVYYLSNKGFNGMKRDSCKIIVPYPSFMRGRYEEFTINFMSLKIISIRSSKPSHISTLFIDIYDLTTELFRSKYCSRA